MTPEDRVVIPPIYDRPGNLLRKMSLLKRYIDDIHNMLDYYGWIFTNDPWFATQLEQAEAEYARLEELFNECTKGVTGNGEPNL